jgi:hypothetical protein
VAEVSRVESGMQLVSRGTHAGLWNFLPIVPRGTTLRPFDPDVCVPRGTSRDLSSPQTSVPRGRMEPQSVALRPILVIARLCGSVSRPRLRPRIVSEIIEEGGSQLRWSLRVRKIRNINDQNAGSLYLSGRCADTLNSFSTPRANTAAMTAAPESAPANASLSRAAPGPDRDRRSIR